jgi:glycosyl transferase family 1
MHSATQAHRLPFRRIAVTVPPPEWFHGISRALFEIYRGELAAIGLEIFDVPVEPFLLQDVPRIDSIIADLRGFRPELAFGLHRGAYALLCRLPPAADGWRPNLFTEILDIPTICLWDHAPLELADQLLAPHPASPDVSLAGAHEKLIRVLTHPRLIHWSPDTGQTKIMKDLGFLLPDHVIEESLPTLAGFHPQATTQHQPGVAFVGHFYQDPRNYPDPALKALAENAIQTWLPAPSRPLWYRLLDQIGALDPDLQTRLALHVDHSYFWGFAHRLVLHDAQTALRLKVLESAGVPVTCYGDLNTELAGVPRNVIPVNGHIPYGPELAACLARHDIVIDVFNPGSIHGYSHKPMITFASGGFMLVNRKRDFIAAFGEAGEAVSYEPDSGDLAVKIDRFLTNPEYLREVGDTIRETIATHFQLKDVLARVMEASSGDRTARTA